MILHNKGTEIEEFTKVIIIELAASKGALIKPHVAIRYNARKALDDSDEDVIAAEYLNVNIADGKVHKLIIKYERIELSANKLPHKSFQLKSTLKDYFNRTYENNWIDKFRLGVISVHIDDEEHPLLQYIDLMHNRTFANLGVMIDLIDYQSNYL